MDRSALIWVGAAVALLVFLDILFIETRRMIREGTRIFKRVRAYGELPILSMLATANRDFDRLARASEDIPALIGRGQRAVATLRSYLPKGTSPG
jgi:hypothetical protein